MWCKYFDASETSIDRYINVIKNFSNKDDFIKIHECTKYLKSYTYVYKYNFSRLQKWIKTKDNRTIYVLLVYTVTLQCSLFLHIAAGVNLDSQLRSSNINFTVFAFDDKNK